MSDGFRCDRNSTAAGKGNLQAGKDSFKMFLFSPENYTEAFGTGFSKHLLSVN